MPLQAVDGLEPNQCLFQARSKFRPVCFSLVRQSGRDICGAVSYDGQVKAICMNTQNVQRTNMERRPPPNDPTCQPTPLRDNHDLIVVLGVVAGIFIFRAAFRFWRAHYLQRASRRPGR